MDNDFDIDRFLAELHADVPLIHRLGFFSDVFVDYLVEFNDVAAKLRELGESPDSFTDEFGYLWSVTDFVIEQSNRKAAWVEWKRSQRAGGYEDHTYYLKARVEADCFKWTIETVNPYFGCFVHHLAWHSDSVVMLYEDKHTTYAASMKQRDDVRRIEIAEPWTIECDVLVIAGPGSAARLSLPEFQPVG